MLSESWAHFGQWINCILRLKADMLIALGQHHLGKTLIQTLYFDFGDQRPGHSQYQSQSTWHGGTKEKDTMHWIHDLYSRSHHTPVCSRINYQKHANNTFQVYLTCNSCNSNEITAFRDSPDYYHITWVRCSSRNQPLQTKCFSMNQLLITKATIRNIWWLYLIRSIRIKCIKIALLSITLDMSSKA